MQKKSVASCEELGTRSHVTFLLILIVNFHYMIGAAPQYCLNRAVSPSEVLNGIYLLLSY